MQPKIRNINRARLVLLPAFLAILVPIQLWGAPALQDLAPVPDADRQTASAEAAQQGTSSTRELTSQDLNAWLDGYMADALRRTEIPGAVVVVVRGDEVLASRGFGFADPEKRTPVDPERTLFRPGSVSKLFTWIALMQLVDDGKVNLDDDINRYLDFRIDGRGGHPITVRDLMRHTAGFEERGKGVVFYDGDYVQPLNEYLKQHVPKRIFDPGTTPAYSNYGAALAGYIVERVSGEEISKYVKRHIFIPLGMRHSTFWQPVPASWVANLAVGYPEAGVRQGFEFVGPGPAGVMSSTGTDMARFMMANLNDGQLGGYQLLSSETMRLMLDAPVDMINSSAIFPPLAKMRLGYFDLNLSGTRAVGHLGDTNAFHSALDLLLDQDIGIFVSVSGTGKEGAGGDLRLSLPEDFTKRYIANPPLPRLGVSKETAAEHVRMMSGLWQSSRRGESSFISALYLLGQIEVQAAPNGSLLVPEIIGSDGKPLRWVEIAPFLWQDVDGQLRLAAKVEDGKVVRWSTDFASPWAVFDRVPAARAKSWIIPALVVGLAVFLAAVLYWPTAWLIRRKYGAASPLTGSPLRTLNVVRGFGLLAVILFAGWAAVIMAAFETYLDSPYAFDTALWVLQIASLVILPGLAILALLNLVSAWKGKRVLRSKIWSLAMVLASLMLLYFAVQFGFLALTVEY